MHFKFIWNVAEKKLHYILQKNWQIIGEKYSLIELFLKWHIYKFNDKNDPRLWPIDTPFMDASVPRYSRGLRSYKEKTTNKKPNIDLK